MAEAAGDAVAAVPVCGGAAQDPRFIIISVIIIIVIIIMSIIKLAVYQFIILLLLSSCFCGFPVCSVRGGAVQDPRSLRGV